MADTTEVVIKFYETCGIIRVLNKGSERPLRFRFGSHIIEVETVEDRWHSPDITYFRVLGNDSKTYVLKRNEG